MEKQRTLLILLRKKLNAKISFAAVLDTPHFALSELRWALELSGGLNKISRNISYKDPISSSEITSYASNFLSRTAAELLSLKIKLHKHDLISPIPTSTAALARKIVGVNLQKTKSCF